MARIGKERKKQLNIFEFLHFLITISGIIVGGYEGHKHHGIIGATVGATLGGVVGLAAAFVLLFSILIICKLVYGGTLFTPKYAPKYPPPKK